MKGSTKTRPARKVVQDCDVVREIEALLGPQEGTGYIDATGAVCGPQTCAECGREVEVAYHALRPAGEHPLLLDGQRTERFGSWYLFRRSEHPGVVLAEYLGRKDPRARFFNHRLICPTARVSSEANPQGGATDAARPEPRPLES